MPKRKPSQVKSMLHKVWSDDKKWSVHFGRLRFRSRGRPSSKKGLFQVVAEKLPFEALDAVLGDMKRQELPRKGVYIAHDSMGYARYVGRGHIPSRLRAHKKAHDAELAYFSFFVVEEQQHQREIETLLIRAAGPLLQFNTRKKRVTIQAGSLHDYEAKTAFYERQRKKGKKT